MQPIFNNKGDFPEHDHLYAAPLNTTHQDHEKPPWQPLTDEHQPPEAMVQIIVEHVVDWDGPTPDLIRLKGLARLLPKPLQAKYREKVAKRQHAKWVAAGRPPERGFIHFPRALVSKDTDGNLKITTHPLIEPTDDTDAVLTNIGLI